MAKIQIKSEKLTLFGGFFRVMEQFDSTLSSVIDSTLGLRCRLFGCFFIFFNPIFGPLEKVCGYRSTIKILFCPFIKLNNG